MHVQRGKELGAATFGDYQAHSTWRSLVMDEHLFSPPHLQFNSLLFQNPFDIYF